MNDFLSSTMLLVYEPKLHINCTGKILMKTFVLYDLFFIDTAAIHSFGFNSDNSRVAWWKRMIMSLDRASSHKIRCNILDPWLSDENMLRLPLVVHQNVKHVISKFV